MYTDIFHDVMNVTDTTISYPDTETFIQDGILCSTQQFHKLLLTLSGDRKFVHYNIL